MIRGRKGLHTNLQENIDPCLNYEQHKSDITTRSHKNGRDKIENGRSEIPFHLDRKSGASCDFVVHLEKENRWESMENDRKTRLQEKRRFGIDMEQVRK